jgi:outer membrane protein assembly factor BamB
MFVMMKNINLASKYLQSFYQMYQKNGILFEGERRLLIVTRIDLFNICFQWPNQGGGLLNTRHACLQKINPSTISKLALKWQVNVGLDVTVTPSASNDGVVYVPSFNGNLYAINAKTGNVLWARNLTSFIPSEILNKFTNIHQSPESALIYSRTTPVITKKTLLVGIYGPAILLSLHRDTGDLIWSSLLDQHPYAVLTMSGTVYKR